jgi:hypothetical protein
MNAGMMQMAQKHKLSFPSRIQRKYCLSAPNKVSTAGIREYITFLLSHSSHGNETCSEGQENDTYMCVLAC